MKQNENGRSMIEMLGVLAIVGVLSVLGLAAYNKAISKYKCNQTIHYITQIAQQTRIAFGSQRNYSGLGSSVDEIRNVMFTADLAPKEMLVNIDENGEYVAPYIFKNPFKGDVSLRIADQSIVGDQMAFIIRFENLPKSACIEVATSVWGNASSSGFVGMTINQANNLLSTTCVSSAIEQKGSAVHCGKKSVMPAVAAANACLQSGNYIELKFY